MKPDKISRKLREANPGTAPRRHILSGTGLWLYWQCPSGETLMIGVAATFDGTTYRRLTDPADISDIVNQLWGETQAWQLGKLLEATANALSSGAPLPTGISAQAIPIVRGDNPAAVLDRLWLSGPANSILHKKKPLQQERHDISGEGENSPLTERASPEQNNLDR